ncbi:MAG TPA: GerMN domain-containing protein [Pseudolysinimonas sp.]|jgi:hypothetical protein|nr:GerMN domain-containing protein [Pseudolysinimonas sp.]
MTRRRIGWVAALGAVALLSGCVGIPTSGDVTTQQVDVQDQDNPFLSLPPPPQQDASPDEIVADFLRAGRGPQNDYKIAREYLTDDFRKTWSPYSRTLISSSPIEVVALADNTYSVTISSGASIDDRGQYQTAVPSNAFDLTFGLVKNDDGQWRISSAPNGTVLSPDRFASIFERYELYFYDPSYQFLVPDLRWFRSDSGAPSTVVDALLAGPGTRLGQGSLLSAFPKGTTRDDGAPVTISRGLATVALSSDAADGSVALHRRMEQQLLQTLRSVGSVTAVDLTAGGLTLDVPDDGAVPDSSYLVGNAPIGVFDGRLGVLGEDGTVSAIAGIGTAADIAGATGGSIVSKDRSRIVMLAPTGVTDVRTGREPAVIDARTGLVVPSLDPLGYTWSVQAANPRGLLAIGENGVAHAVPGLPQEGQVLSVDVSRDGARLLVALQTDDGPQLTVYGIKRNDQLVPTGLSAGLEVPIGDAPLRDAAWVDGVTVVALTEGTLTSVDAYEIGGQHTSVGALSGGMQIVGGNGIEGTRVLDDQGHVLRPGGGTLWQDTGIDASFLVTQQ